MSELAAAQDAESVIAQEFLVDDPSVLFVNVPGAVTTCRPGPSAGRVKLDISVVGCDPEEAEPILDRLQIGIQQKKDALRIIADPDRSTAEWWRWVRQHNVTVHVDLRLPPTVELDLTVPSGEAYLKNLEGYFMVKAMGSRCDLQNLTGTLQLRAERTDVSIDAFSGDEMVARVAVGDLSAQDIDVNDLTLRSVNAPLTLTDAKGDATITANSAPVELADVEGPCTARAQGGPLSYTGAPATNTHLRVVGSSLTTRLPASHAADLTMRGASLSLDDQLAFEGDRAPHLIEGTLRDGGSSLTLEAIGGSVDCTTS